MSHPMADLVGPFYRTDGVAHLLGLDEDWVTVLRETGQVLGVQTSDDEWIYPKFQFTETGVDPRLLPVLVVLAPVPRWSAAVWLRGPEPELDGLSPVEWVRQGRPGEMVLRLARHYAHHVTS